MEICKQVDPLLGSPGLAGCAKNQNPSAHYLKRKETNSFDLTWFCAIVIEAGRGNVREWFPWSTTFFSNMKILHFYQCQWHNQYQQYCAETKFGWSNYICAPSTILKSNENKFNLPKTNLGWKKLLLLHSHAIIISPKAGQGGMHTSRRKAQTLLATHKNLDEEKQLN